MAYQDTIKKLKRLKGHLGLADKTDKTDKTGSVSFVSAQQGGSADVQESIVSSVNTSQLHVKKALPLPKGIKKEAPEVPDKTDKTLRSSTHQLPEGVTLADLEAELGTDPDWPKIKVSSYLFGLFPRSSG
jgi:hypothetical protein